MEVQRVKRAARQPYHTFTSFSLYNSSQEFNLCCLGSQREVLIDHQSIINLFIFMIMITHGEIIIECIYFKCFMKD